jgi:hypothetical protein
MNKLVRLSHGTWVLLVGAIWGCMIVSPPPPPPSAPFFIADPADLKTLQTLGRKLDALAAKCGEQSSCDQVLFTRALVALYESREAAVKSFQRVITAAPNSRLAASSSLWIQLLRGGAAGFNSSDEQNATLTQVAERLVWQLLDRERKIEELTNQLEALKRIEQEVQEKTKPIRPPPQ